MFINTSIVTYNFGGFFLCVVMTSKPENGKIIGHVLDIATHKGSDFDTIA